MMNLKVLHFELSSWFLLLEAHKGWHFVIDLMTNLSGQGGGLNIGPLRGEGDSEWPLVKLKSPGNLESPGILEDTTWHKGWSIY